MRTFWSATSRGSTPSGLPKECGSITNTHLRTVDTLTIEEDQRSMGRDDGADRRRQRQDELDNRNISKVRQDHPHFGR